MSFMNIVIETKFLTLNVYDYIPFLLSFYRTSGAPSYTPPTGYYSYHSPQPNQRGGATRKVSMAGHECQTLPPTVASVSATGEMGAPSPWKRRLSTTLKTIVSSPRFHRKRFDQDGSSEASGSSSSPQT